MKMLAKVVAVAAAAALAPNDVAASSVLLRASLQASISAAAAPEKKEEDKAEKEDKNEDKKEDKKAEAKEKEDKKEGKDKAEAKKDKDKDKAEAPSSPAPGVAFSPSPAVAFAPAPAPAVKYAPGLLPMEMLGGPGDRLSDECQEPNATGYGITYDGSMGPEKIFCCKTAEKVVKSLMARCKDCEDAVPCWKTMEEKWCVEYMKQYKDIREEVCLPRPPTTTLFPTTTTRPIHELDWCFEMCSEVAQTKEAQDPDRCKKFCNQAEDRFYEKFAEKIAKKD